jgi:hypothetical protein
VPLKRCSSQQQQQQLRIFQLFVQHCRRIFVPDSRVTVPIEEFAQTMRSLFPRYASASDERLIDTFASENPQCRLLREGANVSLENLASVFRVEEERQAEGAILSSESTPGATLSPVLGDELAEELIESGKSEQGGSDSGETVNPSSAIQDSRAQSDANDGRPKIASFEFQEEKKRPVALWVACIIGVLALCGAGIYYAQHAKVQNRNNTPLREAAPIADANACVPESASTVQERQAEVVKPALAPAPAPPVVVKTDPYNSLPALGIDQLFQRFHAPHGGQDFVGKRIRIRGKIETLGKDDVSFVGRESPLSYWFDIHGFGDKELNSLKEGDTVEVVCEFTGNRASIGDDVMRWSFHGLKVRKVSP